MQRIPFPESLRHALRHLVRAPGFTLVGALLLATGIGTVTLVYSVINGVLIRPLPYPESERLIGVQAVNRAKSVVLPAISISDFRDFRARQRSLTLAGAYRGDFATWQRPDAAPVQLSAALVTEDFFRVLGVPALMGRTFAPQEFSVSAPRAIVLSYEAWQQRFNGDTGVVGRVITIAGQPTTVVGVMPQSLREPAFVEVWLPFSIEAGENFARDSRYWVTIGRLAAAASPAQVQAEASAIAADLASQYPETNTNWMMAVAPLHELRVGQVKTSLWVLFGATALLLVVACLNLANLLLARGLRRRGEMAVRLALGATRPQLVVQMLWENAAVVVPGALLGLAFARAAVFVFVTRVPPQLVPRAHEVSVDTSVVVVAIAASIVAGCLAGLLPALQAGRADVGELLKDGTSRSGFGRGVRRAQALLLGVQLATTFVVLTGATLLWRSLVSLNHVDPGFSTARLYSMQVSPRPDQYETNQDLARYFEALVAAVAGVPGVEGAALDASAPLTPINLSFPYKPVGSGVIAATEATYHFVTPGYFSTLELPLVRGRLIDGRDDEHRSPVVLVNETMARQLAGSGEVIGRRLTIVPWLSQEEIEIVGEVRDTRQSNLSDAPPAQLYLAQRQIAWFFSTLLVKARADQPLPFTAIREALQKWDPGLPVRLQPLSESIARTTAQPRLLSVMFVSLGVTTLVFTLFGVYACISLSVTYRTPEFGLRMALGASAPAVIGGVSVELAKVVSAGIAVGLLGAWLFGSVLRGQLYGVGSHDPMTLVLTAVVLAVASMIAAVGPLMRIVRVNPSIALRHT